jgi:hypothetical protein
VFANDGTATAAMTSIYSQMNLNSESFMMAESNGLLSDELVTYLLGSTYNQLYTNSMNAATPFGCWIDAYNYIFQLQTIIR